MNERQTPETDRASRVLLDGMHPEQIVRSDFARRLERERDEAREEIRRLKAELIRAYTPESRDDHDL